MKEIPLTQGKVALVDDEDYERISRLKWHPSERETTCYAVAHVYRNGKRTTCSMHRFVLGLGPGGPELDHRDNDGLHNWRSNLRKAAHSDNMVNTGKHQLGCASIFKVVTSCKRGNNWRAQIRRNGPKIHLGKFDTQIEAARAYDAAARQFHGQFARVNFPLPGEQCAIQS